MEVKECLQLQVFQPLQPFQELVGRRLQIGVEERSPVVLDLLCGLPQVEAVQEVEEEYSQVEPEY